MQWHIVKTYTVFLNTRQRTSGTTDNASWLFNTPMVLSNTGNRFLVCVKYAEIPVSFNQLNGDTPNFLRWSTTTNGAYTGTITFPKGNYNITNLLATTESLLITALAAHGVSISNDNLAFSYNSATGQTTFAVTGTTLNITFQFSQNEILAGMFGYIADVTFSNVASSTSPFKVQVNPITSIYIRSETLKFQSNFEAIVSSYENSDIVAKIQVQSLPNSVLFFQGNTHLLLNNTTISSINLYITDNIATDFSTNLCGLNWGVQLEFSEVMIPAANAGKDLLPMGTVPAPQEFVEQEKAIVKQLVAIKKQLEQELQKNVEVNTNDTHKLDGPPAETSAATHRTGRDGDRQPKAD
jgi:hypothetical protein